MTQPRDSERNQTFGFDAFALANRFLAEEDSEPGRPDDFGPYHFVSDVPLGRGSLGAVWLAEEQGELAAGRSVAVKLLYGVAHKSAAANEVQIQCKLVNQFIATLYNHGVLEDGTPWLAIEFVDGQPLDEYCRTHNCTIDQRLRLFHAVCEGVLYAHSEKIDHGDLKPSNILVKSDGQPKLLDFGLARRLRNAPDDPTVLGLTPAYAAPEQFLRESSGFRSDVYSLGVILYELVAGELPYDLSNRTLAEIADLKNSAQKPAAPSSIAKRSASDRYQELNAGQWHDLDALCLKAMAGDVKERYASVETLLQELERFGECQPLQARLPHCWTYRLGKFFQRYRGPVLTASLVILLVAAGAAFYTFQLAKARNAALAEASRTHKVREFFLDAFDHVAEDALPDEKIRIVNLFLDRATRDARSLKQDPSLQADIYQGLGKMYKEWGVLGTAERLFREALAIDEAHLPENDTQTVGARLALGDLLEERGAYDGAIAIGNEVLRAQPEKQDRANIACKRTLSSRAFRAG